jgi:hypothetical protein
MVVKITTLFIFNIVSPPKNLAVYEIMWKNNVESEWPQMTIWRMRITWWITEAVNATSECAIIFDLPRQQWLPERG